MWSTGTRLRPKRPSAPAGFPPAYDQGQLGSCTANAIGGAFAFEEKKQKKIDFMPSRLFIYYNERAMEGTVGSDSGAQIRDGVKVVATLGTPPETDWPYDIENFATPPPPAAYADAKQNEATSYFRIDNTDVNQLKSCLAAGFPFVFGIAVYQSFESQAVAKTGVVPMPLTHDAVVGGHAILGVGYDDQTGLFKFRMRSGQGRRRRFPWPRANSDHPARPLGTSCAAPASVRPR